MNSIRTTDELTIMTAIFRSADKPETIHELSELQYQFEEQDYQDVFDAFMESMEDHKPWRIALSRKLIQKGHNPNDHAEAVMLGRMAKDMPPMAVPDAHELRDSVDRLNRYAIAQRAAIALSEYQTQAISYSEMIENLKALDATGNEEPGVSNMADILAAFENYREGDTIDYGVGMLDKYCKGLQRNRMTVLAARPGVGKSDFALHIARTNLKKGRNVLFCALEMDTLEIAKRMGKAEGIGGEWRDVIRDGWRKMQTWPGIFRLYDAGSQSVAQISARVRDSDDLVIVDYMQIMRSRSKTSKRYEIVTELSNDLRAAAKRSNAAWLVLSQLSRQARTEKDKPTLADLRESGAIEQDAHSVVFLHEPDGKSDSDEQKIIADVAKNRGAKLGKAKLTACRSSHTWRES